MWSQLNTGQVKLHQRFGQLIEQFASDPAYTRYLEIGSWNGRGSTICFASGFSKRPLGTHVLKSFEINPERVDESKSFWVINPHVEIIHGRILPSLPDVRRIHSNVNESWQAEDARCFESSPYVDVTSFKPEVVLLDGGEYITYFEYELLEPMVDVFLLDDTGSEKCRRIFQELSVNSNWKLVEKGDDRNWWAVFQRLKQSS